MDRGPGVVTTPGPRTDSPVTSDQGTVKYLHALTAEGLK
jgi:hypothetical protein